MKMMVNIAFAIYGACAVAGDEDRPCQVKASLIDTRDGGVSIVGSFGITLLGSIFTPDPSRPDGCNKMVTSTGKANPRSIVQSSVITPAGNYIEKTSFKRGYVAAGTLTFKRLTFSQGVLELVALPHPTGYSVSGIWRETTSKFEVKVFPALIPADFSIQLSNGTAGWTLNVVNAGTTYPLQGLGTNELLSSEFGALKEFGTSLNASYVYFSSEELCIIGRSAGQCF